MRVTTRTCVFAGVIFAILSLILGIMHASVVAYAVAGLSALFAFGMASFSSDQ